MANEARPYSDPTPPAVLGALKEGVDDPSILVDESWTPEQKKRWSRQFNVLVADIRRRSEEAREQQVSRSADALGVALNEPPLLRDVGSGIRQGAKDLWSLGLRVAEPLLPRHESEQPLADVLNRQVREEEETYRMAGSQGPVMGLLQTGLRGAARSLTTAIPLAATGGGAPVVIGGFAGSRANQAITEATDAGLTGSDKWGYVGRAALIEGGVAGAAQALGLGGFETMLGRGFSRAGVKEFLKQTGFEVGEENVTEILDAFNQSLSGVSGPVTTEQAWEIFKQTTVQTILTMGGARGYQELRAGDARLERLAAGLANRYEWDMERARGVVDRARRRGGPFLRNLGREVEEETVVTPEGLSEWALDNESAARTLAAIDSPSRGEWAQAGMPRRPKALREKVVRQLRAFFDTYDAEAPPATEPEPEAEAEAPPAIEPSAPPAPPAPPPLTADELRDRVRRRMEQEGLAPPEGRPHWSVASLPRLKEAQVTRSIPPEDWTAAARRRHQLEVKAIEEGSQDWRTADLETLRGLAREFKVPKAEHHEATERLAVLSNPVPEGADWRTADEDTLRSLLHAGAVHPDERSQATSRLVELARPRIEAEQAQRQAEARAAQEERLREQFQPFLEAWEEGERDAAVLTKGWPRGSEAGNRDLLSADTAFEAGIINEEQRDVLREGLELREEELSRKREARKKKKARAERAQEAKDKAVIFASGLSRSPKDMREVIEAGEPVGVAAFAKRGSRGDGLSSPVRRALIDYANAGGKVFVDSGAFTAFKAGTAADWTRVRSEYGAVFMAVDTQNRRNVYVVAPDLVGDQEGTLDLQDAMFKTLNEWEQLGVSLIVPVQKGDESLAAAWAAATDNLQSAEQAIVGLPYNAKAWSEEEALEFLRAQNAAATEDEPATVRLHLLGGGRAKVESLIDAAADEGLDNLRLELGWPWQPQALWVRRDPAGRATHVIGSDADEISGDSLYKGASERKRGKKEPEAEETPVPEPAPPAEEPAPPAEEKKTKRQVTLEKQLRKARRRAERFKNVAEDDPSRRSHEQEVERLQGELDDLLAKRRKPKKGRKPKAKKPKDEKPKKAGGFLRNLSEEERAAYEEDMKILRGKLNNLNTGLDPETFFVGIRVTGRLIKAGVLNFREYAEVMLEELGPKVAGHLRGWWVAAVDASKRADLDDANLTQQRAAEVLAELQAEEGPSFEDQAREILLGDEEPAAKGRAVRRLAKEHGITVKEAQERTESILVEIAREVATDQDRTRRERFNRLVALYEGQPRLSAKTDTSVEMQAYSTPLPLAYAASVMAEVHEAVTLYEPTAGMGALTMAADPSKTHVNELWDARRAELGEKGYRVVTGENAATWTPEERYDRVLANPPFGGPKDLKEVVGRRFVPFDGYRLSKLDHVIAARALEAMEDGGVATLILGSDLKAEGELKGSHRVFVNWLMAHYHVVGNYEVLGALYAKQNAKFPVRLITVAGRRSTPLPMEDRAPELVERLATWNDVWLKTEEVKREIARVRAGMEPDGGRLADGGPGRVEGPNDPGEGARAPGANGGAPGRRGARGGRGAGGGGRAASGESPGASGVRPGVDPELEGPGRGEEAPGGAADRPAPRVEDEAGESDPEQAADPEEPEVAPGDPGADAPDVGGAAALVEVGEEVNDRQVAYSGASRAGPLGTIVNKMLAPGMARALTRLRAAVGDVDTWLADKLGYPSVEAMHLNPDGESRLGREQVDGVALAIHNMENGRSLVIGDQTGIGKGRQAAALMAYAKRQGYMPVFLTVDPKLFSDMYADTRDIGKSVSPLLIGDTGRSHVVDKDTKKRLVTAPSSDKLSAIVSRHVTGEESIKDAGYDAVFMAYSQLQNLEDVKGGEIAGEFSHNVRHRLLNDLAENSKVVFILDESHKAAGADSVIGAYMRGGKTKKKNADKETVEFELPGVLNADGVEGVVYLSATYAKRPETMPLYFKTALGIATDTTEALMKAFKKGGVALQQWAANALAMGGEMIRRERDFAGVRFETKNVATSPDERRTAIAAMDRVAAALRAVNSFSRAAAAAIKADGSVALADTDARLVTTEFASVIHNYVAQTLLASKVQAAVDEAVASHKRGEATVIVLSNTMESFLDDFARQNDLSPGDTVEVGFADVLERALRKTLSASVRTPGGAPEHVDYSPEDLGLEDQYEGTLELIRELVGMDLPVSPIDAMHQRLRAAGLRTAELTGREVTLEYGEGEVDRGTLRKRSGKEKKNKNAVVNAYQSGELDVVILNSSGSTGLSLHASARNPKAGQRPRHMILAQPDLNIDTVKQALGRILRTGMAGEAKDFARYTLLSLPVEAERRPFAVLAAKLASLNANTTADADDDVQVASLDFLNKYGDQIVSELLYEDRELARLLGIEISVNVDDDSVRSKPGVAKQATGRMAILPNDQQAEFYALVSERYADLVAELREAGQYDLEVEIQEKWDAQLVDSVEKEEATDPAQPFTSGLTLGKWSIRDPGKPMRKEELRKALKREFGSDDTSEHKAVVQGRVAEYVKRLEKLEKEYLGERPEEPEAGASDAARRVYREKLDAYEERYTRVERGKEHVLEDLAHLASVAGQRVFVTVRSGSGNDAVSQEYAGVLVGLSLKVPKAGNPYRPNVVRAKFAVESPRRTVSFSLARMANMSVTLRASGGGAPLDVETWARTVDLQARATRFIYTGNLILALDTAGRGQITAFRTSSGEVVTGLVMPAGWKPSDAVNDPGLRVRDGGAAARLLSDNWNARIRGVDSDGKDAAKLTLTRESWDSFRISVSVSRAKGGPVYLDRDLRAITGPWHNAGRKMEARGLDADTFTRAVDHLLGNMRYVLTAVRADVADVARAHGREAPRALGAPAAPAGQVAQAPPAPPKKGRKARPQGVQPFEVVRKIEQLWPGLVIRGAATMRRRMKASKEAGWYVPGLGEIRLADNYDAVVALHELGHHFDRELDDWSTQAGLPAGVPTELVALGRRLYGNRRPRGGSLRKEGFAEFIRDYLLGQDVQAVAPRTYAWFTTEYLQKKPEEARKLRELEDLVLDLHAQTAEQAMRAFRRPPERGWRDGKLAALAASFEERWRDAFLPLLRAMQATGADLGDVPPQWHPYMLATAFARTSSGRTEHAALKGTVNLFGEANGPGLRQILEPVTSQGEQAFEDWKDYAIAMRALHYHKVLKLNPGLSLEHAEEIVAKHGSREGFRKALQGFTDFAHRGLHVLVEAGYMTEKEYDEIRHANPIYVYMLRRVEEDPHRRKNLGTGGRPVHRIKGGGNMAIHDPVDALLVQYERIQQKAMQHAVLRAMVKFYDDHVGEAPFVGQFMSEVDAPLEATTFAAETIRGQFEAFMRKQLTEDERKDVSAALERFWDEKLTVFQQGSTYKGQEAIVPVVIDGQRRFFQVRPELLPVMEGIANSRFTEGDHGRILRAATNLQRLGATGLNPAFAVRNAIRDTLTAAVTSDYHWHVPFYSTAMGFYLDVTGHGDAERFHAFGLDLTGRMSEVYLTSEVSRRLIKADTLSRAVGRTLTVAGLREIGARVRGVLSHVESAPRIMEHRAAYAEGLERFRDSRDAQILAACAAKDLTVNFTRAGSWGRKWNEVVLFLNAGVQGIDKAGRAFGVLEAAPWNRQQGLDAAKSAAARSFGLLTVTSVLLYLLFNRDDEEWRELPPHEKWGYLHFPGGVRIPLPFDIGSVWGALPVALIEEERTPGALKEALGVALQTMTPLDLSSLHGFARNVAFLAPAADVLFNSRWNGSPILPDYLRENRVLEDQVGPRTTWFGKVLSAHWPIGKMNPAEADHLLDGYTGGLYLRLMGALETMADPSAIDPRAPSTLPVIGTLFLRPGTSRLPGEFYDRIGVLKQRAGSEEATLEELGELAAAERVARELQGLWAARREAIASSKSKGAIRKQTEALHAEALELIRAHNARDKKSDRAAGLGNLVYRLTSPSSEGGAGAWAQLEGVTREEAVAALRAEVRRRGGSIRPRAQNGSLTAYGRRLGRLLRGLPR